MIYFIIAALIVMLDQLVKYFITMQLTPGVPVPLIPGVIRLFYQENTGAAFSFLKNMPWLLLVVSGVVILLLIIGMIRYRDKIAPVGKLGLAFVLGGAASHLLDRAVLGYVVDYLEFEFVRFAIMDLADWFITVGGVMFCLWYLLQSSKNDALRKEFMFGKQRKTLPDLKLDETPEEHAEDIKTEDDGEADQP